MQIVIWFESVFLIFSLLFTSITGFFNGTNKDAAALQEQAGGYIYGVCHPDENYDGIHQLGLGWVRFDIPYPYSPDGSLSESYKAFKVRAKGYADQGIKVMAITPYPRSYFEVGGFDPSADENAQKTKDIAVFLCNDLRDIVGGIQITNEMGIASFTYPLTLEQAAKFIGIQAEALNEVKGDLIIGYNSSGKSEKLHNLMKPYLDYMDYVGVDLYYGTWSEGGFYDYATAVRTVNRITKKPIIVAEFGFVSTGEPKTDEQRAEILASYGYDSEEAARADIENFVSKLPDQMKNRIYEEYPDPATWGDAVFSDMGVHFYSYLNNTIAGVTHSPEGQAEFYRELLPALKEMDCVAGFFIFCWKDSPICWYCGQSVCPYETAWGINDLNGQPKPAFYAIKEVMETFDK